MSEPRTYLSDRTRAFLLGVLFGVIVERIATIWPDLLRQFCS